MHTIYFQVNFFLCNFSATTCLKKRKLRNVYHSLVRTLEIATLLNSEKGNRQEAMRRFGAFDTATLIRLNIVVYFYFYLKPYIVLE